MKESATIVTSKFSDGFLMTPNNDKLSYPVQDRNLKHYLYLNLCNFLLSNSFPKKFYLPILASREPSSKLAHLVYILGNDCVLVSEQRELQHGPAHPGQHDILRGPQVSHILQYYTHHTSSLLHKNVIQFCHARYSIVVQNPTNWALVIENVQAR